MERDNKRGRARAAGWQAAILGLGEEAGEQVLQRFAGPTSRFPGFYKMHFDYTPEVDTGAVAKLALQAPRPPPAGPGRGALPHRPRPVRHP